ncbi:MAG: hypothetical protein H6Q04_409 [Acidobacteria bacterium]|nr:hypothetical protein [Acidobacteriota bacterium]
MSNNNIELTELKRVMALPGTIYRICDIVVKDPPEIL